MKAKDSGLSMECGNRIRMMGKVTEIMKIKECLRPAFGFIAYLYAQLPGNVGRPWDEEEDCEFHSKIFSK